MVQYIPGAPGSKFALPLPSKLQPTAGLMVLSAFGKRYHEALKDLTTIEVAKLKLLRDLARENPKEADSILQAIVHHVYTCPEQQRLPALYLVDIVLKTAGERYNALLSTKLPEVFEHLWDRAKPDLRAKLVKTATTWRGVIPDVIMDILEQKMQPPSPPTAAPIPQQTLLYPRAMPMQPLAAYPVAGQYAYPQQSLAPHGVPMLPAAYPLSALMLPPQMQHAPLGSAVVAAPVMSTQPVVAATPVAVPTTGAAGQIAQHLMPNRSTGSSGGSGGSAQQDPVQAAVEALFADTARTKSRFLDLQFVRNTRLQKATHPVRSWYVRADRWLEGLRALEDEGAPAEQAEEEEAAGPQLLWVEEDPSQPTCAISGEPFERTYDPDTDKWYYEDAVLLTAEQAEAHGLQEGSIVKSSCLAGGLPAVTKSTEHHEPTDGTAPSRAGKRVADPRLSAGVMPDAKKKKSG